MQWFSICTPPQSHSNVSRRLINAPNPEHTPEMHTHTQSHTVSHSPHDYTPAQKTRHEGTKMDFPELPPCILVQIKHIASNIIMTRPRSVIFISNFNSFKQFIKRKKCRLFSEKVVKVEFCEARSCGWGGGGVTPARVSVGLYLCPCCLNSLRDIKALLKLW